MTTKPNKLTPDQAETVKTWLETVWVDIEHRRLSRDTAAGLCAAAVGFRVTAGNLAGICRRLAKKWPSDATADQRLGYRIQLLKRAVGHVYRTLGIEPADGDVARLLNRPWPAGEAADEPEADEATDPDFLIEREPIS